MVFISKSKYLVGLQCPLLLFIHYKAKQELPPVDEAQQALFDQGHDVGEWAKKVFPEGVDIPWDAGYSQVLNLSKEALIKRIPLFEAGFQFNNAYSRIDILLPVENDQWDIIEVKSTTNIRKASKKKVDDIYLNDIAFQTYCCQGAGLKIRKSKMMYLNNEYVRQGDINPQELFIIEDLTESIQSYLEDVDYNLQRFIEIINSDRPTIKIGPHCKQPYDCTQIPACWAFLPEQNIFNITGMGNKGFKLLEEGIQAILDIPSDFKLSDKQRIQKETLASNHKHIDKAALQAFLGTLHYPVHYFDFETYNPGVPLHDNSRPYQHIPFQYSLHIQEEDGIVIHKEFLHTEAEDPRPSLLASMKEAFKDTGSIVVYYQSFEKGKLLELARDFPEYKAWVDSLLPRFVDLYEPFSTFLYYDPKQNGSASLKATMPSLTGKGYEHLEIGNGSAAMRAYESIISDENMSTEDKEKVRADLLVYCGQDTEGMIWMIEELKKLS